MAVIIVGCAKSEDIENLQSQIDEIKNEKIKSVSEQVEKINGTIENLKTIDSELRGLVSSLQEKANNLQNVDQNLERQISALETKDAELQDKIDELKTYVDTQLSGARSWINATFATLDQFNTLSDVVAGIKTTVDAIPAEMKSEYISCINSAISESETSMKSWVSEKLAGYYTIAEMNAKLNLVKEAYEAGDEAMEQEITNLSLALEKARTDLSSAYESAISSAIDQCEGRINTKIASDLATANAGLQEQINTIKSKITQIEIALGLLTERVENLEALLDRIQSMTVIPTLSDGSVGISSGTATIEMEVMPLNVAQALSESGASIFSVGAVYTDTKAETRFVDIPVSAVTFDGEVVSLTVSGNNLDNGFYLGQHGASARVRISDGNNSRTSEYFCLSYIPEMVDLGLSVKWASCNIGAFRPEEYGGYYQWAGLEDMTSTDIVIGLDNCPYHTGTSCLTGWTKYIPAAWPSYCADSGAPDNKLLLDFEDDIAYVTMGGKWHIPTEEEWTELISNCTRSWTNNYQGTNVAGAILTSNKPGYTDKCIFLPATGYREASSFHDKGFAGYYGSASFDSIDNDFPTFVYYAGFHQNNTSYCSSDRSVGARTIRPVYGDRPAQPVSELSVAGSANCYIVPVPGKYMFNALGKGNSNESVGSPVSAEVLWETYGTGVTPAPGDIVKAVSYKDRYVYFEIPDPMVDGNAVIAVKDASGTILWSWHIWACAGYSAEATAQIYKNGAGTMMDRNLGALSAVPGDERTFGLLYQWGRKDPFMGGCTYRTPQWIERRLTSSTLSWPADVVSTSTTGTIEYSVKHPTTFIAYNTFNRDWIFTGNNSTDRLRWQDQKTKYDPCPLGWKVPAGGPDGIWARAYGSCYRNQKMQ